MSKFKSPLILLLSAALILFGAMLPKTVAAIQDDADITQVNYAPISEVHLEFDEDTVTIRQLLLTNVGAKTHVPVPDKFCTRTTSNVLSITQETIDAYMEAGLIPFAIDADECVTDCKAFLSYDAYLEESAVIWTVVLCAQEWSDWNLGMTIDDQSGRILAIDFLRFDADLYPAPVDDLQEAFCKLYLEGLGSEFSEFDAEYRHKHTQAKTDMSEIQTHIQWWDPNYGDVTLTVFLHTGGFHTYVTIPK